MDDAALCFAREIFSPAVMRPPTLAAVGWWTGSDRARRLPYLPRLVGGHGGLRSCKPVFLQLALMRGLLRSSRTRKPAGCDPRGHGMGATQRRGLFMSLCGLGSSAGAIAAPPIIAFLALQFNWRAAFRRAGRARPRDRRVVWLNYRDPRPRRP